ncbi:MAG: tetratricopeptide repeat protein [Gemmatimonadetes bacterium]|nr:tetratricopeptide repeat protein [Gemmatimonadota bacterium]MYB57916.1 tetratricopeptide repeat protein [Gemmatimonadota bacterium]
MQYILLALIVSLIIFTQKGCAVAQQPTDGQNPDQPTIKPDEPAQPAASLLTSGRNILQQGINENNLDAMYAARATFERAMADKNLSAWSHYYIALTDYRIANYLLAQGKKNKDRASDHLKEAAEHLEKVTREDITREDAKTIAAEVYALLSSVYGRQISLSGIKGMFLGPKSGNLLKKSEQLAPDNPRVVLSAAISAFNTPKMWGGSKERAIEGFQRAAHLFAREKPTDPIHPVWGHSETYAWLGIAYMDRDEENSARAAFEKALEIDPNNGWVKYDLLPKMKKEN